MNAPAVSLAAAVLIVSLVAHGGEQGETTTPAEPETEWNRPQLVVQLGHTGKVLAVAISPDGKTLVTGGMDKHLALWDQATGEQLRRFKGRTLDITCLCFSPDGRCVASGGLDEAAVVWDARTGAVLRRFRGHRRPLNAVRFSPDGRQLLTASEDNSARLWDVAAGKELQRFQGHSSSVETAVFSPDGRRVLTGSADKTARLWDAETGTLLVRLEGHTKGVQAVAFLPDGRRVVTGGSDKSARLWDATDGKQQQVFLGHRDGIHALAVSPDGSQLVTAGGDATVRQWHIENGAETGRYRADDRILCAALPAEGRWAAIGCGKTVRLVDLDRKEERRRLRARRDAVTSVAFAPDSRRFLIGCQDGTARLWDLSEGREIRRLAGHSRSICAACFSPDGTRILTVSGDQTARVWAAETGAKRLCLKGHDGAVTACCFAPHGAQLLTGGADQTARLWDAATGAELRVFPHTEPLVGPVLFSADGQQVLAGGGHKAVIWETATGREIQRFQPKLAKVPDRVWGGVCFLPGGKQAIRFHRATEHVMIPLNQALTVWDVAGRQKAGKLEGHHDMLRCLRCLPDGRQILTGSDDGTVRWWDIAAKASRLCLQGHVDGVTGVDVSADGRYLLTGSLDNTVRLWDAATGKPLCQIVSFREEGWVVVTDEGRFDQSENGDVTGLHWVVGDEPIEFAQLLTTRYYEPGLLAKLTGFHQERMRPMEPFSAPRLFPAIEPLPATLDKASFLVRLTNRGGGIGRLVVTIDGKEVTADARGPGVRPDAERAEIPVDLTGDPRLEPGKPNVIDIQAYDADGFLRTRGFKLLYTPPGALPAEAPQFWAIVAGANDFPGAELDLRYAVKDATDFAQALAVVAPGHFGADRVHLRVLTTGQSDPQRTPTRQNLKQAFEAAQSARPIDTVLVYLAGHGDTHGAHYYYLTCDATRDGLLDPQVRQRTTISSPELIDWLNKIPAKKLALILDTCAAGRVIQEWTGLRYASSDHVRECRRMRECTGLHLLAGCAADRVSYEASHYGGGLLTSALLWALSTGHALRTGGIVDVVKLYDAAEQHVEILGRGAHQRQRPQRFSRQEGGGFCLGEVTEADLARIPARTWRPCMLPSRCGDATQRDVWKLESRVDRCLRDVADADPQAAFVFTEERDAVGAYRLHGPYRTEGQRVMVEWKLFYGSEELATIPLSAATDEEALDALAARVVAEATARIKAHARRPASPS